VRISPLPDRGGDGADGGVDPLTIVVAFDIGEQVAPRGVAIGVLAPADKFGFQRAEETLHRRVVPAVSLTAHRLGDGGGPQDIPIVAGGVLAAADALLIVKQRSALDLVPRLRWLINEKTSRAI
jgi:hypothetical protein